MEAASLICESMAREDDASGDEPGPWLRLANMRHEIAALINADR